MRTIPRESRDIIIMESGSSNHAVDFGTTFALLSCFRTFTAFCCLPSLQALELCRDKMFVDKAVSVLAVSYGPGPLHVGHGLNS